MLHNNIKGKGIGKLIFESFEAYVKALKNKCIRIDVVTNYDNYVLIFWIKSGFVKDEGVKLNGTGENLPAVILKKNF